VQLERNGPSGALVSQADAAIRRPRSGAGVGAIGRGGRMGDRSRAPVVVPAELSKRLGFGEQPTTVRALASGPRTVLLERLDAEGGAVPWDRDLVLCADVRAFPLADVMQLVHASGKSGFLLVEHADCAKC